MSSTNLSDPELEAKTKKATERLSENMHIVANEPSLAFFRVQEHVRKALPPMVEKRMEVSQLHQHLQGHIYDVEYAIGLSLISMKEITTIDQEFVKQCVASFGHARFPGAVLQQYYGCLPMDMTHREQLGKQAIGVPRILAEFSKILSQDLESSTFQHHKAIKSFEGAEAVFSNIQEIMKNSIFVRQQLKYEENRKKSKEGSSVYKRLSAHITLDLPDLPEFSDAIRETANKVESIMASARQTSSQQ